MIFLFKFSQHSNHVIWNNIYNKQTNKQEFVWHVITFKCRIAQFFYSLSVPTCFFFLNISSSCIVYCICKVKTVTMTTSSNISVLPLTRTRTYFLMNVKSWLHDVKCLVSDITLSQCLYREAQPDTTAKFMGANSFYDTCNYIFLFYQKIINMS